MLRLSLLLILLVVKTVDSNTSKDTRKKAECVLDSRTYREGESWHPVVPPFGAMPCVNCSCGSDGEVECKSQTCPKPDCPHPHTMPGQCCPSCEDFENVPPTEVRIEKPDPKEPWLECDFHGANYKDGDIFPSNKTALKATSDDQCVLCVCTRGRVLCHLKSCPAVRCREGYVNVSDDCCPQCKGDVSSRGSDDWLIKISTPLNREHLSNSSYKLAPHDCLGVDGIRQNGTTWSPEVHPFGLMKCVRCSCLNGKIECHKQKCPSENSLPCKRPRLQEGECCKTCRRGRRRPIGKNNGRKTSRSTIAPSIAGPVDPGNLLTQDKFDTLCPVKRSDRLVYQIKTAASFTIAFDTIKKSKVEVLRWTMHKGRLSTMRRESVPTSDFRPTIQVDQVAGSTNKRHYKKFKRRLSRQFKRCEKKKTCRPKHLIKAFKKLRLRKVKFSADCAQKKN